MVLCSRDHLVRSRQLSVRTAQQLLVHVDVCKHGMHGPSQRGVVSLEQTYHHIIQRYVAFGWMCAAQRDKRFGLTWPVCRTTTNWQVLKCHQHSISTVYATVRAIWKLNTLVNYQSERCLRQCLLPGLVCLVTRLLEGADVHV